MKAMLTAQITRFGWTLVAVEANLRQQAKRSGHSQELPMQSGLPLLETAA
ncbi:MAG: hypothetical protein ABI475_12235 [Methylophilaceae bacterium]